MSARPYETLRYEVDDDRVATITLDRPECGNACNATMCEELARVWMAIKLDPQVHAVVLRGAGERAFSVGIDPDEGLPEPGNIWNQVEGGAQLGPRQSQCWKPVICAVHGLAAGAAFFWINESDIVICSEDAQFWDPHTSLGQVPSSAQIGLSRMVHPREALRIALMGEDERLGAQTALRIGLVSEVLAREALHERAREIAAIIAAKPSAATQGAVRAVWESLNKGRQAALDHSTIYSRIGNPLGEARVDRSRLPTDDWSVR